MLTATRRIEWDAGHRVFLHGGKCNQPHGHRYAAEITVQALALEDGLDALGMVVDFSAVKAVYGEYIDRTWDHGFLVYEEDTELLLAMRSIAGAKVYCCGFNPTAENIARWLGMYVPLVEGLALYGVEVIEVKLYETPNCFAVWKK